MTEYLKVLRPEHWLKNVFIIFGHLVAIVLLALPLDADLVIRALLSLVPACFIASANYIMNEILDAPFDRMHPTKRLRAVPTGTVSIPILWGLFALLCLVGFSLAAWLFSTSYLLALGGFLLSALFYNMEPIRLKDKAFLDVIAESFNNPIRLWLGWYALAPADSFPPLSILLTWWFFGALLMAGKRYAEMRFIGNTTQSGQYRKSFTVYTEKTLILSMVTYANCFCFCMGVAMTTYKPNLVLAFPLVVLAIVIYLQRIMTEAQARREPEHLLRDPLVLASTFLVVLAAILLAWTDADLTTPLRFFELIRGN